MNRISSETADAIWEKHKEQFSDFATVCKDSSTFWQFLLSLVSKDDECEDGRVDCTCSLKHTYSGRRQD